MRLYRRCKQWDLMDSISRCYLDADRGYVAFAFERLNDLEDELGEDAKIWYAKGTLYLDFVGQGLKAYDCFVKARALDPQHAFAACNAAQYAPSIVEYRRWADIAWKLSPEDRPAIERTKELLNGKDDVFYRSLQHDLGIAHAEDSELGKAAARIEISLQISGLEEGQEIGSRRWRAERLRELDKAASQQYETRYERFAPQDRLALAEAIAEIDRALALDKYDEKMWNFKSAWCYYIGRYEDSIAAADKAIQLSPQGYHRPYINKAQSLIELHRIDEARECARKARQIAEQSDRDEVIAVIPWIDQILSDIDAEPRESEPTFQAVGLLLSGVVTAALVTAERLMGKMGGTLQDAVAMFRRVLTHFPWGNPHATGTALDYVPLMAQALAYAPPEYWWMVVQEIAKEDSKTYENCKLATLYIAAHADPIMQRDALRLLLLTIFIPATSGGTEQIIESPPPNMIFRASALKNKAKLADELRCQMVHELYRRLILEVSAAATDEMVQLDRLMQQELARIQPELPAAIAEQNPVEEADKARARATILSQLQGIPFIVDPSTPRLGSRPGIPEGPTSPPDLPGMQFPQDLSLPPTPPAPRSFVGRLGFLIRMAAILLTIAGFVLAFLQNSIGYWLILAGVLAWWSGGRLLTAGYVQDSRRLP